MGQQYVLEERMSEQRKSTPRERPRERPSEAEETRQPEPAEGRDWRGKGVVGDRHTD
jgi:hypothetical protein